MILYESTTTTRRRSSTMSTMTTTGSRRRRARSLSPTRRAPCIQHTNGRLDKPVQEQEEQVLLEVEEEEEIATQIPPRIHMRRVHSCGNGQEELTRKGQHIGDFGERFRQKCQQKTHELYTTAQQDPSTSTSALLAKKALRYRRKVFLHLDKQHQQAQDQEDPTIQVSIAIKWAQLNIGNY